MGRLPSRARKAYCPTGPPGGVAAAAVGTAVVLVVGAGAVERAAGRVAAGAADVAGAVGRAVGGGAVVGAGFGAGAAKGAVGAGAAGVALAGAGNDVLGSGAAMGAASTARWLPALAPAGLRRTTTPMTSAQEASALIRTRVPRRDDSPRMGRCVGRRGRRLEAYERRPR